MNIEKMLKALSEAKGVSGEEGGASEIALNYLKKYSSDASIQNGSVVGTVGKGGRPRVLLDAHIDQIGLIVTDITEDGFLRFSRVGGVDPRLLPAQHVLVHGNGTEPVQGVICSTPPHLSSGEPKAPKLENLFIDIGCSSREEAMQKAAQGDRVSFDTTCEELLGGRMTGPSLDDRAGVAAILYALHLLDGQEPDCTVQILFSTQEEVGCRGAKTRAYALKPDIALAVDVTFAKSSDEPETCGELGKGPMVGIAPCLDRALSDRLAQIADKEEIPYQIEVMGNSTGTDADEFSVNRGGCRAGTVSIPLRYMHTPVEVIEVEDVKNTGRLLAAFLKKAGKEGKSCC